LCDRTDLLLDCIISIDLLGFGNLCGDCCFFDVVVVAQVEQTSTVENQPVEDPPSMKFTWTIENFTRLNTKKHYSDVFIVGSYKW